MPGAGVGAAAADQVCKRGANAGAGAAGFATTSGAHPAGDGLVWGLRPASMQRGRNRPPCLCWGCCGHLASSCLMAAWQDCCHGQAGILRLLVVVDLVLTLQLQMQRLPCVDGEGRGATDQVHSGTVCCTVALGRCAARSCHAEPAGPAGTGGPAGQPPSRSSNHRCTWLLRVAKQTALGEVSEGVLRHGGVHAGRRKGGGLMTPRCPSGASQELGQRLRRLRLCGGCQGVQPRSSASAGTAGACRSARS